MSAYVVSDYHINALVTWAATRHGNDRVTYYWEGRSRDVRENPKRIASVLYAENVRSVNARYNECDTPSFRYRPIALGYAKLTPVQVLKACNCYEYQACETDDWEQSEACAIINGIREEAVSALPGYEEAEWELNQPAAKEAA